MIKYQDTKPVKYLPEKKIHKPVELTDKSVIDLMWKKRKMGLATNSNTVIFKYMCYKTVINQYKCIMSDNKCITSDNTWLLVGGWVGR